MSPSGNYKGISLFTIAPDEPLPFHVAVHYKGRYILYRTPGQSFEVSRYNRFIYKRIGQLYIPEEEVAKYEEYVASKAAEEQRGLVDPSLSPEQRFANKIIYDVKHTTRDLFMIDTEDGRTETVKRVLNVTQNTVEQVLSKPYMRIFDSIPDKSNDIIAHSMRVSLLSTYVAYQLGYVNPVSLEYLAAAALLHDIGKTRINLPDDLEGNEVDEAELMKRHPIVSCELLQGMGFIPEEVTRIILEHHEARDGSGYPNGIRGPKMHGLSRVFVIVNTFDNLVSTLPGDRETQTTNALNIMTATLRNKFDAVLLPKAVKILGQRKS